MVHRKSISVDEHCEIALTTEQMTDGWGVVVSIKQHSGDAERVTDLPVPEQRFDTRPPSRPRTSPPRPRWLARNAPRAA